MTRNMTFAALAVAAAVGVLATTAALANRDVEDRREKGGNVMPCSLEGVNPVHHPEIFGNPAAARSFGFYLGPDRAWHVVPGCRRW